MDNVKLSTEAKKIGIKCSPLCMLLSVMWILSAHLAPPTYVIKWWTSIFPSNVRSLVFSLISFSMQEIARYRGNYSIRFRHVYWLTMLFIFEDDEPALCFLRLLTSSTFPSFGFKIILLLPAVPSDEDRNLLSINLPSRYGLRLLARTIAKDNNK